MDELSLISAAPASIHFCVMFYDSKAVTSVTEKPGPGLDMDCAGAIASETARVWRRYHHAA
jgi:hypothetical protein